MIGKDESAAVSLVTHMDERKSDRHHQPCQRPHTGTDHRVRLAATLIQGALFAVFLLLFEGMREGGVSALLTNRDRETASNMQRS